MDERMRKIVETTSASDFDGHTEFPRMTPDQRLAWLDEANAAYLEFHGLARVAEESPKYGSKTE